MENVNRIARMIMVLIAIALVQLLYPASAETIECEIAQVCENDIFGNGGAGCFYVGGSVSYTCSCAYAAGCYEDSNYLCMGMTTCDGGSACNCCAEGQVWVGSSCTAPSCNIRGEACGSGCCPGLLCNAGVCSNPECGELGLPPDPILGCCAGLTNCGGVCQVSCCVANMGDSCGNCGTIDCGGNCVNEGPCASGSQRCNGNLVQSCDAGCQWQDDQDCSGLDTCSGWGSNFCDASNNVVRTRTCDTNTCSGFGCALVGSTTQTETVQNCNPGTFVGTWSATFCTGQQLQRTRTVTTNGCAGASCFSTGIPQTETVANCAGTGENNMCVAGTMTCNHCADGLDNDGDGFIDAADPDCGGFGQCNAGDCCDTATGTIRPNTYSPSVCRACTGALTSPLTSSSIPVAAGFDTFNQCAATITSCPTRCSMQGVSGNCNGVGACQAAVMVSPTPPGLACIGNALVPAPAEVCNNDIDDDCDGLIDGQDPDCPEGSGSSSLSLYRACNDGVDNDGDGRTDADDSGCCDACTNAGNRFDSSLGTLSAVGQACAVTPLVTWSGSGSPMCCGNQATEFFVNTAPLNNPGCCDTATSCVDSTGACRGGTEVCSIFPWIDEDCDGHCGYDSQGNANRPGSCPFVRGDLQCPVEVTAIAVNDTNPGIGAPLNITCTTSIPHINSVAVYVNEVFCDGYEGWIGNDASFICNAPNPAVASFDVNCTINTSRSHQVGFDQIITIQMRENTYERCTNGLDDDGDLLIDTQDPDCYGNIEGTIYFTQNPSWLVQDAEVFVSNLYPGVPERSTRTNHLGEYLLTNVFLGEQYVRARKEGFVDDIRLVNVLGDAQTVTQDFYIGEGLNCNVDCTDSRGICNSACQGYVINTSGFNESCQMVPECNERPRGFRLTTGVNGNLRETVCCEGPTRTYPRLSPTISGNVDNFVDYEMPVKIDTSTYIMHILVWK